MKYKHKHPRFRLFGRFLGLYDELTDQDLKLYVDIVHNMFKSVLNFQIQEQDEVVLVPTGRACDYFRTTFATRLTNTSMSHCLKIVSNSILHLFSALVAALTIFAVYFPCVDTLEADHYSKGAL